MKKRKQVHQVAKALAPRSNAIKDSPVQPSPCVYGGISWRQKQRVGMCGHLTCCTFFYLCETKKCNRIQQLPGSGRLLLDYNKAAEFIKMRSYYLRFRGANNQ